MKPPPCWSAVRAVQRTWREREERENEFIQKVGGGATNSLKSTILSRTG